MPDVKTGIAPKIREEFDSKVMPVQAVSVAADVATLKTDFNALLTKLKAAGLMAAE